MKIKTAKLLGENLGRYLYDIRKQKNLLNQTQNPQTRKEKMFEIYLLTFKISV